MTKGREGKWGDVAVPLDWRLGTPAQNVSILAF